MTISNRAFNMLSATVIVPTFHRPQELSNFLESLLLQSRLPSEVLVVDDGNLETIPFAAQFAKEGVPCIHLTKDKPGLTESRNLGCSRATGDVVLFFDDDVILDPEYLSEVMRIFEDDVEKRIGGVSGCMDAPGPMSLGAKLRYAYDLVFLMSGTHEGRVLPSGFCASFGTTPFPVKELRTVDFLPGAAFAFRREVFELMSFSPGYREVGFGEDKDFSFRVSRLYRLVVTPRARFQHLEVPLMRPDKRMRGRKRVHGTYHFFKNYCRKGPISRLAFAYSMTGYLVLRSIVAIATRRKDERERVAGVWEGLVNVALNRVPEPAATAITEGVTS
jgi:glucosyl-dolichyl phosphate glucuronosyltransferase